ncbi:MAG: hypothetical protein FWC33_05560 [Candidatus Bathyarchaeota archaeon]|nr:hypothetical protein [Candidatus Termiticorpusculum sp.]
MTHTKTLITQLQQYLKKCDCLNEQEKAAVTVFGRCSIDFLVNSFLQNNLYGICITVKQVNRVAERHHNTPEGYPVPLCAVEVYEINLWTIDNPAYRSERVTDFLEKTTEAVCSFFYNNPVFGREKSVNPHDTTVKQQHLYCNSILVTRTNEDLSDYKQQE